MAEAAQRIIDDNIEEVFIGSSKPDTEKSSVEIMREIMVFNHVKAKNIILDILMELKKENRRGDLIAMMYKKYTEVNTLVIDCAAKLAPYEKPRLQSIEVKSEVEHKFVLRAPTQLNSTGEWLSMVKANAPAQLQNFVHDQVIKQEPQDTKHVQNKIIQNYEEDEEEIEEAEILDDVEGEEEINKQEF